ncbi:MAG: extracellular nuclease [Bacteroidetes bacterium]|nr:MAG: extracellular nuclease [Bacteroidota bacterium]
MKRILFAVFLAVSVWVNAQDVQPLVRIGFYNVENLFDTIDDPKINDEEFLPGAKNKWNTQRYTTKLKNLSKVILEMNGGKGMDVLGVCEVENKKVLEDLTQKTGLKTGKYGIVHMDSPDERGIDVALLYKKNKVKIVSSYLEPVKFASDTMRPTRSILVVKAMINKKTPVYFLVNHWPSRRGGEKSESLRICAANALLHAIGEIRKKEKDAAIVAMGDFNDTPSDESIEMVLDSAQLVNLMMLEKKMGNGSHYYKKEKNIFDQLLVSESLLKEKQDHVNPDGGRIYQADWMMGEVYKGDGPAPLRTFAGSRYLGWYSDHLPVYVDLYPPKK